MSKLTHSDIFKWMEQWAPKQLAYDWDPVGLQVGTYNDVVNNILVTLDVDLRVTLEAIENNVNLIISHHPLLFKAVQSINTDTPQGKLLQKLLAHEITVYAAHTNLDIAQDGVNDALADLLSLQNKRPMADVNYESLYKIVVFVPESHAEQVRHALSQGGAGHIGNYSHCTYQSKGEGTFKPLEGTDPFIGTQGKIEYVPEYKIESIVPKSKLNSVVYEMIKAHPYEEVAYDIYPLANQGEATGLGRIGKLAEKMSLEQLIYDVKQTFQLETVRVTGSFNRPIEHIAIVGGSGEKYIQVAKRMGADVLITGDVTYHQAQLAEQIGLAIIDVGHYIEHLAMKSVQQYLQNKITKENIQVYLSKVNTNPFQNV